MWVNRKLRRDCPGNPSRLGMEVLKRMASRENTSAGAEVASPRRRGAANRDGGVERLSWNRATLCHARSSMAL